MAQGRVGYALGYGKFTNVREMADVMKQAEERGFEMAFFSETIELMRDSVSSLAAIGLATKKLKLGTTQIVRLRGPVVMAQSLATLDELTGGRMTVAPGACTKSHARVHALPRMSARRRPKCYREYIESMRLLLNGEKVSYHGKFVNFDNVGLGWKPIRTNIPFYVPATATVGLKLGGRDRRWRGSQRGVLAGIHGQRAENHSRSRRKKPGGIFPNSKSRRSSTVPIEDDHKKALDAVRWEVATKLDPVQISFIAGAENARRRALYSARKIFRFSRRHMPKAAWRA